MRVVIGLAITLFAVSGLTLALSSNAPDRPPGIPADRWAPISSTLGIVLVPDTGLTAPASPPLQVQPAAAPATNESKLSPGAVPNVDGTALYAEPTAKVKAIIEEGQPVRGYIMVKRAKVWRPLAVVAPTI
jgi:hypothetical protein